MDTRIKYGIISGIMAVAFSLLTYAFGLHEKLSYTAQEILGYLAMVVSLLVIILAILETRRKQGGYISFGKALGTGMLVALIGGAIFGIGITVMLSVQGDDFMANLMEKAKEQVMASDLPDAEKETQIAHMDMMANSVFAKPWFNGVLMFINVLVLGFIVSLITALALKRNQSISSDSASGLLDR